MIIYKALDVIDHDRKRYEIGEKIDLTEAQAAQLLALKPPAIAVIEKVVDQDQSIDVVFDVEQSQPVEPVEPVEHAVKPEIKSGKGKK